MLIPTIIDSHGNPGILGPGIDVAIVVDVSEVAVDSVELLMMLDVVTVDTIKEVVVAVNMPPNGVNSSIVDSS